jgi:hypothetical protein
MDLIKFLLTMYLIINFLIFNSKIYQLLSIMQIPFIYLILDIYQYYNF